MRNKINYSKKKEKEAIKQLILGLAVITIYTSILVISILFM